MGEGDAKAEQDTAAREEPVTEGAGDDTKTVEVDAENCTESKVEGPE